MQNRYTQVQWPRGSFAWIPDVSREISCIYICFSLKNLLFSKGVKMRGSAQRIAKGGAAVFSCHGRRWMVGKAGNRAAVHGSKLPVPNYIPVSGSFNFFCMPSFSKNMTNKILYTLIDFFCLVNTLIELINRV